MIKSPIDLVIGTFRFWGLKPPTQHRTLTAYYQIGNYIFARVKEQQQDLLNPPTVFGWTAYYQSGYYQQWINSTTLGLRGFFSDALTTNALRLNGKPVIDVLAYVKTFPTRQIPAKLVNDLTTQLLAIALIPATRRFFDRYGAARLCTPLRVDRRLE